MAFSHQGMWELSAALIFSSHANLSQHITEIKWKTWDRCWLQFGFCHCKPLKRWRQNSEVSTDLWNSLCGHSVFHPKDPNRQAPDILQFPPEEVEIWPFPELSTTKDDRPNVCSSVCTSKICGRGAVFCHVHGRFQREIFLRNKICKRQQLW